MSEEKKKVLLKTAMTWAGETFAPGLNEMPAAAADYALRRKFGRGADENLSEGGKGDETEEKTETETEDETEKVGLPEDFPMRHVFDKLGFQTVEEVRAKSREELIALDGIGEKSADAALAYGK